MEKELHPLYLHTNTGIVLAHQDKQKVVKNYFQNHIGSTTPRNTSLNWESLGYTAHDASPWDTLHTI
jgi:hypothetical protein